MKSEIIEIVIHQKVDRYPVKIQRNWQTV